VISKTPAIATAIPAGVSPPNAEPRIAQAISAVHKGSVRQIGATTATRSPRSA
jgi:hypothetical protein